MTRPTVEEIIKYREYVEDRLIRFLTKKQHKSMQNSSISWNWVFSTNSSTRNF
jgi:hypothetical protein